MPDKSPYKLTEREAYEQLIQSEGFRRLSQWVATQSDAKEAPYRRQRIAQTDIHNMTLAFTEARSMREVIDRAFKQIEKAKREERSDKSGNSSGEPD
jgi:aconitase A